MVSNMTTGSVLVTDGERDGEVGGGQVGLPDIDLDGGDDSTERGKEDGQQLADKDRSRLGEVLKKMALDLDKDGEAEHGIDGEQGSQTGDEPDIRDGLVNPHGQQSRLEKVLNKMVLVEEILSVMGERSNKLGAAVKGLEASLEFSQLEIDSLKKENEVLKKTVGAIELEDKRTLFQMNLVEDTMDRLETASKKKNLLFEGVHRVWINEDLGTISKKKRGLIRLIAKERLCKEWIAGLGSTQS